MAVLNADNPWFPLLKAEAEKAGEVWAFGTGEAPTAQLTVFAASAQRRRDHRRRRGETIHFPILQTGVHWGLNSLCVLLMLGGPGR